MSTNPLRMVAGGHQPAALFLAGLAKGSRPSAESSLRLAACLLWGDGAEPEAADWAGLRYGDMSHLRAKLQEGRCPATCNRILSNVRCVLQEAWRMGLMTLDDYKRAADVKGVPGSSLSAGRALSAVEVDALRAHLARDKSPSGARDAALIAVALTTGLRKCEIAALRRRDLVWDAFANSHRIDVVAGKGAKSRQVYLPANVMVMVRAWEDLLPSITEDAGAPLFPRLMKGGRLHDPPEPMTAAGVGYVLQRRGRAAGLAAFTAHDLRRTVVTNLLSMGVDINVVAQIAGHASIQTTARYDHRGALAQRDATLLLDFDSGCCGKEGEGSP